MTTEYMAQVYADIKNEPSPKNTPADVEARLRNFTMWGDQPDGIIKDAADAIRDVLKQLAQVTRERDAADARVKILEAEDITLRALANTEKEAAA